MEVEWGVWEGKKILTSVCTMEESKRKRWRRGKDVPTPSLNVNHWPGSQGDSGWCDEDAEGAIHKHTSSGFEETLVLLIPLGQGMHA